jgi:hypothetical protein
MRAFHADPSRWLFDMTDLDGTPPAGTDSRDVDAARQAVAWARSYLCLPHPELGRSGRVCPFVPRSLSQSLFFCTVDRSANVSAERIYQTTLQYRDWFLEMEPRAGADAQYKCFLLLYPDIADADIPTLIDDTQERLKPLFVQQGLMVGQFHALPPKNSGLWNPDFRPLHSPIPMLVIRNMVPSDLPFLVSERPFVESYLAHFGGRLSSAQRELVTQMHPQILDEA